MNNTTENIVAEPSACDDYAEMWYVTVSMYVSFILACPIHILIISRLFSRISKKRRYHFLIIIQSVTEIFKIVSSIIYVSVRFFFICLYPKYLLVMPAFQHIPS